ncbi:MAG: polysaccharide biosynthesis tyrosine autokinase [Gammaproteobacteria bacterium]|nr:polysaccharide biosynthesis tyrosine autokinase [Gammaproteobacteria bacterium]
MNDKSQAIPEQPSHSLFGEELNIDFQYYLRVLRKHKWAIIAMTVLVTGLAAFYAFTATPIYQSTATLLIESKKANIVSIEEIYGFDGNNEEYYQTQFELLKSRALAEKVIDKLNLKEHPLYVNSDDPGPFSLNTLRHLGLGSDSEEAATQPGESALEPISDIITAENTSATDPVVGDEAAGDLFAGTAEFTAEDRELQLLVNKFTNALTIEPVRRTQLVKITYESPDPELAALVANTVGDTYIESYLDAKMEMTQKAAEWLSDRLGGLQLKLDESERRLIEFREEHQLIDVAGTVGALNEQQVTIATTALSTAQRELAEARSLYNEVQRLKQNSPELLDTIPAVQDDQLIRTFKIEQGQAQRELDELSNRYGAKHPKIVDAESRLNAITDNLNRQVDRVISSIQNDYELAGQKVNELQRALASGKREIQDINKKKFELVALEREVEANRKLYDTFFNRIRETDTTDGLEAANARVSDRAVPATFPSKPKKSLVVALAMIAGLIGSVLIAFLREQMDDTIKGTDEIESRLGVHLLGIIPLVKAGLLQRKKRIPLSPFELKDKKGTFVESIRTIRTSLCLDSIDKPHKRVVITSSIPGEGKSTMAVNLAYSLSQIEKVILIDADMRRPTVAKAFGISPDLPGLADYLRAQTREEAVHISECVVRNINDSNMDVIPCGKLPDNPLELLASSRFSRLLQKLGEHYDRVIIDCAPTQAVSDALVVGKQADTVLYAVKSHTTSMNLIRRGLQRLRQVGAHVLGVVVTQVDVDKISSYGGDYYYQGYYDYYGYSGEGKKKKKRSKSKDAESPSETEPAVAEV